MSPHLRIHDTLIIGGGLSGLALADALEINGHDYLVLEGRSRFGGRIETASHNAGSFDLGPAWFWPGQPRIAKLIARFGLESFEQFSDGMMVHEDPSGEVQQGYGYAPMQGSWRIKQGFSKVTEALSAGVPAERKNLNAKVESLTLGTSYVSATLSNGDQHHARKIVLALPPRIAAEIVFSPALPSETTKALLGIPTWMAGQAKAVAVYETAFWRAAGLSGDATSRAGPLVEIHDASAADAGPHALFGFIGIPPHMRQDEAALRQLILSQLGRLFGPDATKPACLLLKNWAFDPFTATKADSVPSYGHPTYGLPSSMTGIWGGQVYFAGTEVAAEFGGFVEGALEAAENVLAALTQASV